MKAVLTQNISGLGQKHDIKTVKAGYFRNFLFPQGLAVEATTDIVKRTKVLREEHVKKEEARKGEITKLISGLKDEIITIVSKADEKGNLFAGVTTRIILEKVAERIKIEIPEEFIQIEKPIKKIGSYDISVGDGLVKIEVVSEEVKDKKKRDKKKEEK